MNQPGILARTISIDSGKQILYEAPVRVTGALYVQCDLRIGAYTYFRGGLIHNMASVGRYCSIAANVQVGAAEHPTDWLGTSPVQYSSRKFAFWMEEGFVKTKRTRDNDRSFRLRGAEVGHDVWIGANVVIRQGVRIGHGAILAANSVVVSDVEPYMVVGGVPARPIRRRFPDPIVHALLELQWWQYDVHDLSGVSFDRVETAIDEISQRAAAGMKPRPAEHVVYVPEPPARATPAPTISPRRRRWFLFGKRQ